ncbi:pyridoxamine 5'-phosphate oxidase family protein [Paludibaculum fermentans]|uniref:Pyridoxamine 5'-phosphate oxidase family protein n=1 Tax=Paludibaculum fermentans TaxID=1473598 RepID=A0A7S7NQL5_PALFE|nr:pyridoxamine 5'-phosphate oxidase family protein [Paludibaculum fermentans]QOY87941.1 pyridoxamine 5'-phosphate oxidase family protein [Paludibaculum fermentans]
MDTATPVNATIRQHPERAASAEAGDFLAAGTVAHVGFQVDGQPYVIPFSYQYDSSAPDRLYLHGGHSSHTLRALAAGAAVCVTVTMVDGLVYSRTALNHSMNYRSVVCFGRAQPIEDPEQKQAVFARMIERYFPGRTAGEHYAPATEAQLRATALLAVTIESMTAKARRGAPTGPLDGEPEALGTCGVVPL